MRKSPARYLYPREPLKPFATATRLSYAHRSRTHPPLAHTAERLSGRRSTASRSASAPTNAVCTGGIKTERGSPQAASSKRPVLSVIPLFSATIKVVNTARTAAMCKRDLEVPKVSTHQLDQGNTRQPVMTNAALEREQCYRIAMAQAKCLHRDGVISDSDYHQIDRLMLSRFRPILSGLYPKKPKIFE